MGKIKDPKLSGVGEEELYWARAHMPILEKIKADFERERPFEGLTIGVALHLEKKTGILLEVLAAGGASVHACSCNPLSTDDRVAAALEANYKGGSKERGNVEVFAWAGQTKEEYYWCLEQVMAQKPRVLIDDGCDLTLLAHKKGLQKYVLGACEETTTGVARLHAMHREKKLLFPVFAVNDAYSKHLFDNRYGTGQSTLDAIMNMTNILLAGKTVVVAGYGWCGKGIAKRAAAMGARVVVVEIDGDLGEDKSSGSGCHKALEALYDGFSVMQMQQAARIGDLFVTVTGNCDIIGQREFELMKSGAIVCNAGHFDNEIDVKWLEKNAKAKKQVKPNIDQYEVLGKKILLLSQGRLVNLARPTGQGHPIEIMDGSFGIQALCAREVALNAPGGPGVYHVPKPIDELVATLALKANGVELEKPTQKQLKYANSWEDGT
ncbi:adenosylhomocysteinase [Candidatus Parvarchaeota archaeon]|nr:adenosylhomocysteinase [Candidatus Parvarchaeota archaeon]